MTTKRQPPAFFVGALALAFLSGCYVSKDNYVDAPLTPVKFESMQAEQTFYNAILASHFPAKSSDNFAVSADLAVPFSYDHETHQSYRVIINEAIAKADANRDGVITETEAQAYADSVAAKEDKK